MQLLASRPSSLATQQQGQSIKRVHPAITSPLNASQPGAPCNCVSHQPAITFKKEPRWKPALLETQAGHAQVLDTNSFYLRSNKRTNEKKKIHLLAVFIVTWKHNNIFQSHAHFLLFLVSAEHLHLFFFCFFFKNKLTL